ncbi:uncharacterized protein G2W53_001405 [Senna tora]|uniref:Uncharacterized protein n=1 Tax=Senna tora TaxID=362788 RepID=A0A835CLH0_9FABA|nr:uncharacterized protein G2W53_001405 [Senna tora]
MGVRHGLKDGRGKRNKKGRNKAQRGHGLGKMAAGRGERGGNNGGKKDLVGRSPKKMVEEEGKEEDGKTEREGKEEGAVAQRRGGGWAWWWWDAVGYGGLKVGEEESGLVWERR